MAASISGLGSSGLSSIYGNRNVISGLASGMDTEAMIEQAVSGYKMKLDALKQMQTKVTWQQSSMRNLIDMMADFTAKYTSFSSGSNLMGSGIFNSSMNVTAQGKYADKISATGRPGSEVQILGVKQLATTATHNMQMGGVGGAITGTSINLNDDVHTSNLSGSLTLTSGDKTINLSFDETVYKSQDEFVKDINKKLEEADPDKKITASLSGGTITFTNKDGTDVKVTGASGKIQETLKIDTDPAKASGTLNLNGATLFDTQKLGETLAGKEFTITVDSTTKTIRIPEDASKGDATKVLESIKKQVEDAFGKRVDMSGSTASGTSLKLSFDLGKDSGATMEIKDGKLLGLSSDFETSYMNPGQTLESLVAPGTNWDQLDKVEVKVDDPSKLKEVKDKDGKLLYHTDEKGNRVKKASDGKYYAVDEQGDFQYDMKINGESVGAFSKNASIESVMQAINSNEKLGLKASYSKTTGQFQIESKETGVGGKIEITDGLSKALFGQVDKRGQNAIVSMSVNGKEYDGVEKNTNTFDVDGMKVTLNGTFGEYGNDNKLDDIAAAKQDAVTFKTSTDIDKIVNVVKEMVDDYNKIVTEVHKAYTTMPERKSNGDEYAPLTEKEKEGMSETEIKNYEEKAKQGILFGNRDLSNLYHDLTRSIMSSGKDGAYLRSIGIETGYKDGLATLKLDEKKLRTALENEPEKVQEAFSKRKDRGADSDGLMYSMQKAMDKYGSVTGKKGILVDQAGSTRAPSTMYNNVLQKKIDDYQSQISRWSQKMADQIDYYSKQFTQLEQLIAQMNSQSQSLAGLMGG